MIANDICSIISDNICWIMGDDICFIYIGLMMDV